ncbi:MAG: AEC family transporter [SAR324 cluster bacterium]|nr:AEC family transporter [SAR324 cluster bacterium]
MENFIIILAYLLIGIAIRRIPQFPSETGNSLNLFVIYISLPAVILRTIPRLPVSTEILVPAVMPWVMLVFSCAGVLLLSKILKWDRHITGCLLLVVPLGNTSFLGIPMVRAFFGEEVTPYAVLYDQLGSFLALATYGSLVIAFYGTQDSKPTVTSVVQKIITFPPFIALLSAFILKPFEYPAVVSSLLEALGSTLVPVVMIAVGYQLTLRLSSETKAPLAIGLVFKLMIAPLTALILCRAIGLEGKVVDVSIFEAGMPPMVSAGALAILAGLSPALTAALVGLGIVLSFGTLPILYYLL